MQKSLVVVPKIFADRVFRLVYNTTQNSIVCVPTSNMAAMTIIYRLKSLSLHIKL